MSAAMKVVAPAAFGSKHAVAEGQRWMADMIERGDDSPEMDFRNVTTAMVVIYRPQLGPGIGSFGRELSPWEESGIFQQCSLMALERDGDER